jgi:hypothetical protein
MLVVAKSPEILLYRLVLMLRLSVWLWIEACREQMVSPQVRTNQGPESACKLGAAVSNYVVQYAVLPADVFKD